MYIRSTTMINDCQVCGWKPDPANDLLPGNQLADHQRGRGCADHLLSRIAQLEIKGSQERMDLARRLDDAQEKADRVERLYGFAVARAEQLQTCIDAVHKKYCDGVDCEMCALAAGRAVDVATSSNDPNPKHEDLP